MLASVCAHFDRTLSWHPSQHFTDSRDDDLVRACQLDTAQVASTLVFAIFPIAS
jgi:hypothetical protein